MHHRPVCVVIAGLCGSGKSTLRARLTQSWWLPQALMTLSTDDYIELWAQARGLTYSEVFKDAIDEATATQAIDRQRAIEDRLDIIHDQTNVSAGSRRKRLAGLPKDYVKVCLVQHVDAVTRRQRLASRPGKVIPREVDMQMVNSWQDPCLGEGFDIVVPGYLWSVVLKPWLLPAFSLTSA